MGATCTIKNNSLIFFFSEKKKKLPLVRKTGPGTFWPCCSQSTFDLLLTLYHMIPTVNDLEEKKPFEDIVGKGENAGSPHFFPFPTMFLYPFQHNFQFLSYIYFVNSLQMV